MEIDSGDIRKHRNDIIRLTEILTQGKINDLLESIAQDLTELIKEFKKDPPDVDAIANNVGVLNLNLEELLLQLESSFNL